jgi:hypothetical protein
MEITLAVVDFHCHGGPLAAYQLLELVRRNGNRAYNVAMSANKHALKAGDVQSSKRTEWVVLADCVMIIERKDDVVARYVNGKDKVLVPLAPTGVSGEKDCTSRWQLRTSGLSVASLRLVFSNLCPHWIRT